MFTSFYRTRSAAGTAAKRSAASPLTVAMLACALALPVLLGLSGCAQEPDAPILMGTFESQYDGFIIQTDSTFIPSITFRYYYINQTDGTKTVVYAGDLANKPDLYADEGVLIFKVTETSEDTEYGPYPDVGKYYAVRWQNLSASGVCQSGPNKSCVFDSNGNGTIETSEITDLAAYNALQGTDTPEEAEATFTVANGYFPATLTAEYAAK